jgi:formylmethanofuran dehydrogenase subunit B
MKCECCEKAFTGPGSVCPGCQTACDKVSSQPRWEMARYSKMCMSNSHSFKTKLRREDESDIWIVARGIA